MPRLTRASGRVSKDAYGPKAAKRRKRSSVHAEQETSPEKTAAPNATPNPPSETSSARRQTRSQRIPLSNEEVPSIRKRRKRNEAEESEPEPAKRRRSDRQEEREDEPQDGEGDEESTPRDAFFENINKAILPAGTPKVDREKTTNRAHRKGSTKSRDQVEASPQVRQDKAPAAGGKEQPDSSIIQPKSTRRKPGRPSMKALAASGQEEPDSSIIQPESTQRKRGRPPKKKRQKKKVSYGEPLVTGAREASVELGVSPRKEPQSGSREHQKDAVPLTPAERDPYHLDNIGDSDDQAEPDGLDKEQSPLVSEGDKEPEQEPEEQEQEPEEEEPEPEQEEQGQEQEPEEQEQEQEPEEEKQEPEREEQGQEQEPEEQEQEHPEQLQEEQEDEDEQEKPEKSIMIADDSIWIDAHDEDDGPPAVATVETKYLVLITSLMGGDGWTALGNWKPEFIVKGNTKQAKAKWLKSHAKTLKPKRCLELFTHLHHLWSFFVNMPRAPAWAEQSSYLRENAENLKKSIANTNTYVDHICGKIQPWVGQSPDERTPHYSWGQRAIDALHKELIPMFVLVLEESFKTGGVVAMRNGVEITLPDESRFTSSTLQMPLRIAGWMQRLCNLVEGDVASRYPGAEKGHRFQALAVVDRQRRHMCDHLDEVLAKLRGGMDQLEYIASAPERECAARERDEALRQARSEKQKATFDAQERQMQLFVESLQRMKPLGRSEVQRSPEDEYFHKHGGWAKSEDERLLDMIRKVDKPNIEALAPLVPGRTVGEVAQRVSDLRLRMRAKYERSGETPPLWCYERRRGGA